MGLPWWLSGEEPTCQCRRRGVDPWDRKIPWRRDWQPTPVSLLGNLMDRGDWPGYSPWGRKGLPRNLASKQQQQSSWFPSILPAFSLCFHLSCNQFLPCSPLCFWISKLSSGDKICKVLSPHLWCRSRSRSLWTYCSSQPAAFHCSLPSPAPVTLQISA